LQAKGEQRNQREEQWLELLRALNKAELEYLAQPDRVRHMRPSWPGWQWPSELEELLRQ
jgi:hypothetical protein